jgi:4-amino-4-deoxy-L-arabinose transferase-like glycosyltransferase
MRPLSRHLPIAIVMLGAAVLLTWRLGAVYLWQDEAATAVMAERMLQHGKPLAYDGRNLITMDSFVDENWSTIDQRTGDAEAELRYLVERGDFRADTTWVGQPWGQFVAAGASLGLLGHGTWQARLPFALAALVTILLLYLLAKRVFEDRALAVLAAVLLTTSSFWILHSRQCRYYALSSLMLLAAVAAFLRWQRGGRWGAPLFVLAGWAYFQSDFGSFFPTMGVLALVAAASNWPRLGRPAGVFAALGAAVAPLAWYYGILGRIRRPVGTFEERFLGNLFNVNQFLVAIPILALACWFLWHKRSACSLEQRQLLWGSAGIITSLVLWVPVVAPMAFHRYVVQSTPLAALLTAWVTVQVAEAVAARTGRRWLRPAVAAGAGLMVSLTGIASAPVAAALSGPSRPFHPVERPELLLALEEIFAERPDPNRLAIEAIGPLLRPGDEILVNYEDIPFMFYTGARVRGGVAAFRAEDRQAPPPRFVALRRSVSWVHWPVFTREVARYQWRVMATGAPDVPYGNLPDPMFFPRPLARREMVVAERVEN